MPAPLGPLVGFALGAVLAFFAGAGPARDGHERLASRVVALFAAAVYAPVCGYFLAFAPDWAFAYFVDGRSVPSALSLLLVAVDALAVVAGFHLAAARARAVGAAAAFVAVPAALAAAFVLFALGRLRVDATFHAFHADFGAKSIVGSRIGFALLWMSAMIAAGVVVAVRGLRELDRPADAQAPDAPRGRLSD